MIAAIARAMVLAGLAALVACTAGPHTVVLQEAMNFGQTELPADMRQHNLIAVVAFDEDAPNNYKRVQRNLMYMQGVQEGTPEFNLRAVPLNLRYLKGLMWYGDGEFPLPTVALVPDHIARLKAWDVVEYRSVKGQMASKDFTRTGEANIVVRVLCRKAEPDYDNCSKALPQSGKYPGGDTRTAYPGRAIDYGYSFTPAWTVDGKSLRPIPEYAPRRQ